MPTTRRWGLQNATHGTVTIGRVSEAVPFSRTGLDYLGPINIKVANGQQKVWVCLFTCLVTRAVHLEVMRDMTTEEFIMGLRRFIAQRGTPNEIISDNSKTFKLASETVDLVWKHMIKSDDVQTYVSNQRIKWTIIVELAPWMGGFYERLVGLVKRALRKAIGRKLLTDVQFQTIIKEVQSVLNCRPLVYIGNDVNSNIALTPSHFLSLNPYTGIPMLDIDDENDGNYEPFQSSAQKLLEVWKKGQKMLNEFWKLWKEDYLLSLRERTQTHIKTGRNCAEYSPKCGDIVLVKDSILPRGCWKFGKVISLVKSKDGLIRSAKVRMPNGGTIGRPVSLLFPLEVAGEELPESPRRDVEPQAVTEQNVRSRPVRKAAVQATKNIRKVLQNENN